MAVTDSDSARASLISSANIVGDIINGDATTEVSTPSGPIPSLRKALADNAYFQDPIPWSQGDNETNFNQLRTFTDGSVWWSPSATNVNPVPMGATPIGDSNWYPWQDRNLKNNILEEVTRFKIKGTFAAGFTYETADDVGLDNSGNPWSYTGSLPFTVVAGTVPSEPDYKEEDFSGVDAISSLREELDVRLKFYQSTSDMVNGNPFPVKVNEFCTVNSTIFKRISTDNNDISDFEIINGIIEEIIPITVDTTISRDAVIDVREGGGFNVANGVTLTINAQINAGHYQIFYGDGLVQTDYLTNFTPKDQRHRIRKCKAAWFGVVNDAEFPSNYGNGNAPVPEGMIPKGTNSTAALKKAVRFCQWGSMHGGAFLNLSQRIKLEFESSATIFVSGDNIMGEQIFLTELSAIKTESQVSGGDFKSIPEYQTLAYANFNFSIIGNNATILWQPVLASNVFWQARQIVTAVDVDDLNIAPVGFTANKTGILFRNEGLEQKDNPSVGFFNNLSYQKWNNCNIGSGKLDVPLTSMKKDIGIAQHFVYVGYSLGDRLHLNRCRLDNINTFIYCQNPESVEFKSTDCEFRSKIDNAVFFDYVSFFGGFVVQRGGIFMKGQDQTLLRTQNLAGVSQFVDSAQFSVLDVRMEGADGLRKTLLDADWGRFYFRGFNESFGMSSPVTGSKFAVLKGSATVSAKDCTLPRIVQISEINYPDVDSRPIVELKRCKLNGANGIEFFRFDNQSYKFAIFNGKQVPRVVIDSLAPNDTGLVLPNPDYGDSDVNSGSFISCNVKNRDSNGFERINGIEVITPQFIAVKSVFVRLSSMTSNYKKIRLQVGSVELTGDINPSKTTVELIPDNELLVINFDDVADSKIKFDYLDTLNQPISGGGTGYAQIEYRSIQGKLETPSNAGNDAYLV